ncbi:hypothetical protein B586_17835 [Mycobacterium haemophilum DSM 44634]|nr:hypothetical protein B586_17835 [Mycobacterium haemophilum DSM 44634]
MAFWAQIAKGLLAEEAAGVVGVAQAVGARWFHNAGGMSPFDLKFQPSGRYLSFAEREEIALLKSQDKRVRLASLPRGQDAAVVARLLAGCDRTAVVGRRDYAILTMLARLGLRGAEVTTLELSDIDWRSGEITVHGKGNRVDWLPLPVDVGEAIVTHLTNGQPARSERALARYLADEHDHDLSDLNTYDDIRTAATDGSLAVDITDDNIYVLSGLSDDLADGPDAVDRDQLDLAVELLRDIGEYSEESTVDTALDTDRPLGKLVAYVLDPGSVDKPAAPYSAAVREWEKLEQFVESRLRRE